ncbi:AtpZ/AtpI family protein [Desulfobacterales bacterium HSG17]|nr:AtpZ/AtpI family protein [Desulfobacterales bacterium HSG17]
MLFDYKKKLFSYKKNQDWAENLSIVMQLGLTMAGCILFCFFIGQYIDKLVGTKGIFVTIFILLGIMGGANVVYRQILEVTEVKKTPENNTPENNIEDKEKPENGVS